MKHTVKAKQRRKPKRDLFAELSEGMKALADRRASTDASISFAAKR